MSGINFDIGPAITEELHPKPVVQREEGKVMSEASSSASENRLARIQVRCAQGRAEEAEPFWIHESSLFRVLQNGRGRRRP